MWPHQQEEQMEESSVLRGVFGVCYASRNKFRKNWEKRSIYLSSVIQVGCLSLPCFWFFKASQRNTQQAIVQGDQCGPEEVIASAQVCNLTVVDSSSYSAGICETILQASVVPGSQNGLSQGLWSQRGMRYFLSDEHVEPRVQQATQSKGYRQKLKILTMYFCSVQLSCRPK